MQEKGCSGFVMYLMDAVSIVKNLIKHFLKKPFLKHFSEAQTAVF